MIPEDKFGYPIFESTFRKLQANARILLASGYEESKTQNLFYRKTQEGLFYADMRGTEEVRIWQDTSPLFYWEFFAKVPMWQRRRLIKRELVNLFNKHCVCRLSFFFDECKEFEDESCGTFEERGWYDWDEGYCRFCGKDFQNEGSFCSKECEEKYREELKEPCAACGEKMEDSESIRHHIKYFPEEVIFVHAKCHAKIHRTDAYPNLKPSREDTEKFYKKN